ncbi:MAG: rhodanese-like domain-containing protein [Phycisphaerae bacterium]|nr:rhodanese-like domain-containing protein [Phycisphaerae bacterium]
MVIIDVRTQEEYATGYYGDAILIPYDIIEDEIHKHVPNKQTEILVYCRAGRRSKIAMDALIELGYDNVHDGGSLSDMEGNGYENNNSSNP